MKHFYVFYDRVLFYVKNRRMPYRIRLIIAIFKFFKYKPIKCLKYFGQMWAGDILLSSIELFMFGEETLRDAVEVGKNLNVKPFLLYGTLLGYVREGSFIKHDFDIDLGLLEEDFKRKDEIKEALLKRGYYIRIDNEFELSFIHPRSKSLFLDFWRVYNKNEQAFISLYSDDNETRYDYNFPIDIFSEFLSVEFMNVMDVWIPSKAEKFLEVSYGDWKTPQKEFDYVKDHTNLL